MSKKEGLQPDKNKTGFFFFYNISYICLSLSFPPPIHFFEPFEPNSDTTRIVKDRAGMRKQGMCQQALGKAGIWDAISTINCSWSATGGAPQPKIVWATMTKTLEPRNSIITNFYISHSVPVLFKVKLYFANFSFNYCF